MRSHCALYIDAGYLIASAATRATGTSLRSGVDIDYAQLIAAMIEQVETGSGLPLLRVNWYDSGARSGGNPDRTQEEIGLLPRVKLRLGRLSYSGEQKGVDLRIGLDLVTHARNGAVDVMYLVSGDDDLTEAVEEAQGHGVQVIVLAVPNSEGAPHAVSRHLQRECDDVDVLTTSAIDAVTDCRPGSASATPKIVPTPALLARSHPPAASLPPLPPAPRPPRDLAVVYSSATGDHPIDRNAIDLSETDRATVGEVCDGVLTSWRRSATPEQWTQLREGGPYIPPEIDRALLLDLCARLDLSELNEPLRYELRRTFWNHVAQIPGD